MIKKAKHLAKCHSYDESGTVKQELKPECKRVTYILEDKESNELETFIREEPLYSSVSRISILIEIQENCFLEMHSGT